MARFDFRLRALLTLRRARRDACRAELAAALAAERQLAERRQALAAELEGAQNHVRAGTLPGPVSVEALQHAAQYHAALRHSLDQVSRRQLAAARQVDGCRQTVAAADAEVRAIEKLRDRRLDEFHRDEARRDTATADEVARRLPC
jgi:flagellar export protein FliJ